MTYLRRFMGLLCAALALLASIVLFHMWQTRQHLAGLHAQVPPLARTIALRADALPTLPAPVARYARFALPQGLAPFTTARMGMAGDFRRPKRTDFTPTTAAQTASLSTPALVFSANTPIVPGVWATAYDAYLDGRMEMRAKVMDTLTVVDEPATPELDRITLRRWLLEAPLYPSALLHSPFVRWEAVNDRQARVWASYKGATASLLVTFAADGAIATMEAEADADLSTSYHGSGEHVTRSDYRSVQGMMVPHGFVISRSAQGKVYPFWRGTLTSIVFE